MALELTRQQLLARPNASPWDEQFLSKPEFLSWTAAMLAQDPMRDDEHFVDYVRERIEAGNRMHSTTGGVAVNGAGTAAAGAFGAYDAFGAGGGAAGGGGYQQQQESMSINPAMLSNSGGGGAGAGGTSSALDLQRQMLKDEQRLQYQQQQSSSSSPYFQSHGTAFSASGIPPSALTHTPTDAFGGQNLLGQPQPQPQDGLQQGGMPQLSPQTGKVPNPTVAKLSNGSSSSRPKSSVSLSPTPPPAAGFSKPQPTKRSSASPSPSTSTQSPWDRSFPTISQYLTPIRLSRASLSTASKLIPLLSAFPATGTDSVPLEGKITVVGKLVESADRPFWEYWKGEKEGMRVVEEWFASVVGKEVEAAQGERERMLVRWLIKLIDKLDLKIEDLKKYKLAARVSRVSRTKTIDADTRKLASKLVEKFTRLQEDENTRLKREGSAGPETEPAAAKRKAGTPADDGPNKKPKSASSTIASLILKKEPPKPVVVEKPKIALPSFKKKPEGTAPSAPAQSSASRIAGLLVKKAVAPPHDKDGKPATPSSMAPRGAAAKEKKVRKSVRWKAEAELVKVDIVERYIRSLDGLDEDEDEGMEAGLGEVREMEEQEGMSLTLHFEKEDDELDEMDEEVDWYQPVDIDLSSESLASYTAPPESLEVPFQTTRESQSPAIDYPDIDDIPPTPSEPPEYTAVDAPTRTMPLSSELASDPSVLHAIAHAQSVGAVFAGGAASDEDIKRLLSQLTPNANANVEVGSAGATSGANVGRAEGGAAAPPPMNLDLGQLVQLKNALTSASNPPPGLYVGGGAQHQQGFGNVSSFIRGMRAESTFGTSE
ncbi:hypothetical protein MNV49_002366 [Pseudohyphozyma bogoriensis]|nr:hypothetical protein MNV49_002366 [Pseudohyphozyma bogoriensis]